MASKLQNHTPASTAGRRGNPLLMSITAPKDVVTFSGHGTKGRRSTRHASIMTSAHRSPIRKGRLSADSSSTALKALLHAPRCRFHFPDKNSAQAPGRTQPRPAPPHPSTRGYRIDCFGLHFNDSASPRGSARCLSKIKQRKSWIDVRMSPCSVQNSRSSGTLRTQGKQRSWFISGKAAQHE